MVEMNLKGRLLGPHTEGSSLDTFLHTVLFNTQQVGGFKTVPEHRFLGKYIMSLENNLPFLIPSILHYILFGTT